MDPTIEVQTACQRLQECQGGGSVGKHPNHFLRNLVGSHDSIGNCGLTVVSGSYVYY